MKCVSPPWSENKCFSDNLTMTNKHLFHIFCGLTAKKKSAWKREVKYDTCTCWLDFVIGNLFTKIIQSLISDFEEQDSDDLQSSVQVVAKSKIEAQSQEPLLLLLRLAWRTVLNLTESISLIILGPSGRLRSRDRADDTSRKVIETVICKQWRTYPPRVHGVGKDVLNCSLCNVHSP